MLKQNKSWDFAGFPRIPDWTWDMKVNKKKHEEQFLSI